MGVLQDLHKSSIRVSDIASQYWCEMQMELNYRHGQRITKQIKDGKAMHEELENEVNVPVTLQPKSYADALYKTLYTSLLATKALKENRKTRELQLYGSIGGYTVVGKIDQLEMKGNKVTISEDKTRANGNMPSEAQQLVHKIQLMVYRKLLGDIRGNSYGFQNFDVAYKIKSLHVTEEFGRQLDAMGIDRSFHELSEVSMSLFSELRTIGDISDTMQIRYLNQFTGKEIKLHKIEYDSNEMDGIIKYVLRYWSGERKAMPVPEGEKWKCLWCVFYGKECKAWWDQRAL
ncbi:MAG: PD-(D/E)XK nuclease family protein [Candidatus Micrarchaeaceae archaeon]